MPVLSAIAEGETDTADLFFLFALILAVIAAVIYGLRRPSAAPWGPVTACLSLACVAFAWLVL